MDQKVLVAYFSATGSTRRAALAAAEALGAHICEIVPRDPYTSADLNWRNPRSRSSVEMHDAACRPALAGNPIDCTGCRAIVLGFPIWWGVAPRVVDTFLDALPQDVAAQTPFYVFATSGGSGIEEALEGLASLHPALKVDFGKSRIVHGADAAYWAKGLGLV